MGLDHPTSAFHGADYRMAPVSMSHLIFAQCKEIKVNSLKVGQYTPQECHCYQQPKRA